MKRIQILVVAVVVVLSMIAGEASGKTVIKKTKNCENVKVDSLVSGVGMDLDGKAVYVSCDQYGSEVTLHYYNELGDYCISGVTKAESVDGEAIHANCETGEPIYGHEPDSWHACSDGGIVRTKDFAGNYRLVDCETYEAVNEYIYKYVRCYGDDKTSTAETPEGEELMIYCGTFEPMNEYRYKSVIYCIYDDDKVGVAKDGFGKELFVRCGTYEPVNEDRFEGITCYKDNNRCLVEDLSGETFIVSRDTLKPINDYRYRDVIGCHESVGAGEAVNLAGEDVFVICDTLRPISEYKKIGLHDCYNGSGATRAKNLADEDLVISCDTLKPVNDYRYRDMYQWALCTTYGKKTILATTLDGKRVKVDCATYKPVGEKEKMSSLPTGDIHLPAPDFEFDKYD